MMPMPVEKQFASQHFKRFFERLYASPQPSLSLALQEAFIEELAALRISRDFPQQTAELWASFCQQFLAIADSDSIIGADLAKLGRLSKDDAVTAVSHLSAIAEQLHEAAQSERQATRETMGRSGAGYMGIKR